MDPNCVFCKIVAGDIPSTKVYEDDDFLAFLDIHPQSPGHTQVIPKKHYRFVWDVPDAGAYFEVAKKIAKAMQKSLGTDEIFSRVMGDEVHHAHIWLFANPSKAVGNKTDLAASAERIRSQLQ